jgi:dihydrofolate reductase
MLALAGRRIPVAAMPGPTSIEGYAIVSADGMLADANRHMPDALVVKADQEFFHGSLDRAAAVVHGRHSHEGGPRARLRRRLIVTRSVDALAPHPTHANGLLWNPKGATLQEAWTRLGAPDGMLAVIGGPDVYGLFLDIGYDKFHLSRVARVRILGGRPLFPEVGPDRTPEDVLASRGLNPGPQRVLDQAAGATLVTWTR